MRNVIRQIVSDIEPFDDKEKAQQQNVLNWIDNGKQLFRIEKPATPPMHLVSYFVLYDRNRNKMMLIDHVKSGLKLPAGGHVDPDEDPWITVVRESKEELKLDAVSDDEIGQRPLFITTTVTIGQGEHTDVSLWYVIKGDSTTEYDFDKREMNGCEWLTPNEILQMDIDSLDPEMHRFVQKFHDKCR